MQEVATDAKRIPPVDAFSGDVVHVDVGPSNNRRPFEVHRNMLCHYSGYFRGLLKTNSAESKNKTNQLIVEDPAIFNMFVYWLYRGRIPPPKGGEHYEFEPLCHLWVFSEARQIPLLQNDAMELIIQTAAESKHAPTGQSTYVYSRTPPSSPLRRVLIDLVSKTLGPRVLESAKLWPKEALIDLAEANWGDRKTILSTQVMEAFQPSDYYVLVRDD